VVHGDVMYCIASEGRRLRVVEGQVSLRTTARGLGLELENGLVEALRLAAGRDGAVTAA
jgi:hypothetical protein